ncbi:TetR/AcrR family transcriptional regulator [Nocardia sp. NPDC006044]|uniref:TetR/AcrR family transcriptional regulator n=1 Tax=Nocardia sp. NPDC006044 TaxID=3364306 RepID=UPI0036A628FC
MSARNAGSATRLPPGRHKLARDTVVTSQIQRLHRAAFEQIAAHGYHGTSVAAIVAAAGVSRRTFYEFFANKQDCFRAACDYFIATLDTEVRTRAAALDTRHWRTLVHDSLELYLTALADNPAIAQALHVETLVAGRELADQRAQVQAILADRMRRAHHLARQQQPTLLARPDETFDFIIGGIDDRVRHCLQTRGPAHLPALLPLLETATVDLFGATDHR